MFTSTSQHIFCIKFYAGISNKQFIFNKPSDLVTLLETMDRGGIEKITLFNPTKQRFERTSKKFILDWCSWETESYEYLKKQYYFKK